MTDDAHDARYFEDAAYRLSCGPDIQRWEDEGFDESLVGLKIEFDFPHGSCTGTVRSIDASKKSWDGNALFQVVWTCGDQSKEEFVSEMNADDIVAWHFYNKKRPSWLADKKYDVGAATRHLFTVDPKQKMTNFALPPEACSFFPWADEEEDDRWWTTLACLNDPDCASHYDPTGSKRYPLPLLLTMIVLCKDMDPSTTVPMIKSKEKARVFKLADKLARRISKSGRRTGYTELAALEIMVGELQDLVDACMQDGKAVSEDEWKEAYEYCEALILTLSNDFERENDGWHYADDPDRINQVCADFVEGVHKVLLNPPSSKKVKQMLENDRAQLLQHLMAGSFVGFVDEEEEFSESHPQAAAKWKELAEATESLE